MHSFFLLATAIINRVVKSTTFSCYGVVVLLNNFVANNNSNYLDMVDSKRVKVGNLLIASDSELCCISEIIVNEKEVPEKRFLFVGVDGENRCHIGYACDWYYVWQKII